MVDYMKPGTLIIHLGTNDLTKGVNAMRKVRKCVEVIRDLDNTENTSIPNSTSIPKELTHLESLTFDFLLSQH